ncbi:hypothetical protein GEMRC1_002349 [Eukaryota sp. GEM-RC1]
MFSILIDTSIGSLLLGSPKASPCADLFLDLYCKKQFHFNEISLIPNKLVQFSSRCPLNGYPHQFTPLEDDSVNVRGAVYMEKPSSFPFTPLFIVSLAKLKSLHSLCYVGCAIGDTSVLDTFKAIPVKDGSPSLPVRILHTHLVKLPLDFHPPQRVKSPEPPFHILEKIYLIYRL